jgi:hypothetical protein
MADLVTLGGKGNALGPRNHISTLMSSVLDLSLLTLSLIGNIFLQWVVHMCDMMTVGGKGKVLEPGNHRI